MTNSEGDWGETELDPAERADAEVNLDDPSAGDDEPWSPPSRMPRGAELADESHETLEQRHWQEQPDVDEDSDRDDMLGGDDPDAIRAEDDVLGGPAINPGSESGPEAGSLHLEED
jgi:hypothetical protein